MGKGMTTRNLVLAGFLLWLIVGVAIVTAANNQTVRRGCNPLPWWHEVSVVISWPIIVPIAVFSIALGWESTGECLYGKAHYD